MEDSHSKHEAGVFCRDLGYCIEIRANAQFTDNGLLCCTVNLCITE